VKANTIVTTAVLLFAGPLSVACRDSRAGYDEPGDEYSYEEREDFRAAMDRKLDELDAKLERLREKAAQEGAEVAEGTENLIEESRQGLARLRENLADVGSETKERWNDFQREVSSSVDELRRKLDDALD
jgi:phytoene dehydrogenase-like protein